MEFFYVLVIDFTPSCHALEQLYIFCAMCFTQHLSKQKSYCVFFYHKPSVKGENKCCCKTKFWSCWCRWDCLLFLTWVVDRVGRRNTMGGKNFQKLAVKKKLLYLKDLVYTVTLYYPYIKDLVDGCYSHKNYFLNF